MANTRAHVLISGFVQGVFFRSYTRDMALSLDLTGWVMNRHDGDVEAVFEGERSRVDRMIEWCRKGPPSARVENVEVRMEEYNGEFNTFSVEF